MNKKRKRNYRYVAPLRWITHDDLPIENEVVVSDFVIYDVQATADTANMYPAIAQAFNPKIISGDCQNKQSNEDDFSKSKP